MINVYDIRARVSGSVTEMVGNPREYHRVQQILRDRSDLLVAYDELTAELDLLWKHCHVVYWPGDGAYPMEHNPHAGKDSRRMIERALSLALGKEAQ